MLLLPQTCDSQICSSLSLWVSQRSFNADASGHTPPNLLHADPWSCCTSPVRPLLALIKHWCHFTTSLSSSCNHASNLSQIRKLCVSSTIWLVCGLAAFQYWVCFRLLPDWFSLPEENMSESQWVCSVCSFMISEPHCMKGPVRQLCSSRESDDWAL